MRAIKFRFWHNGEMIYPKDFDEKFVIQLGGTVGRFNGKAYDTVTGILMQYTGLKDKHGKEIYEGDIVKMYSGLITEIGWGSCAWTYLDKDKSPRTLIRPIAVKTEVTGNIYENEDLLNESST